MKDTIKHSHADYTIAWVCALPLELAAAEAMLDEIHDRLPQTTPASCTYVLGQISGHHVVLACLPSGLYGTTSAASVASHIQVTFPAIRYGVLVGIGGGVPNSEADIRLGDVVVSHPAGKSSSVIQYDFGKSTPGGHFQHIGILNQPPTVLLTAVSHLKARQLREGTNGISIIVEDTLCRYQPMVAGFSRPQTEDRLFQTTYDHAQNEKNENTCDNCDQKQEIARSPRLSKEPHVHYGTIASGNQVIKDGQTRDRIAQKHHCLCFEMEAAGIMNHLPCLVIRGICDYCDSHKNKDWQKYAALTAAAYAKSLLAEVPISQPLKSQVSFPAIWMVPFEKNPRFLGRFEEIENLEKMILGNTDVRRVAISGLGGVGKTQIALALAYRVREKDPTRSIFWMPSTSVESVEQAFLSIGEHIGLQNATHTDVKVSVMNYLNSESAGSWLLIVDNADDMDMWTTSTDGSTTLKTFLPQSKYGFTLFTTRNRQVATELAGPEVMRVPEMNATEARDLLRVSLIEKELIKDDGATTNLIDQLHGLPLAIIQAASYINKNVITLARYVALLSEQESGLLEMLSKDFEDDWRYRELKNPVAMTWLISFEQIRRLNPQASDYLSFMSCIDPRDIPQSLLPQNDSQKPQLEEALGLLKSYSFVTERANGRLLSIHRLVHLATRNWLNREGRLTDWLIQASKRLEDVFPSDNFENRLLWRELLPHAQFILQSTASLGKVDCREKLCGRVGECLLSDGRYFEAETLVREVFETRSEILGSDHPDTLTSADNLGYVLRHQGKYGESEEIHQRVLENRKQILGVDHPHMLTSADNLGGVLRRQGKYREAEDMHRWVLVNRERVLGIDHPDTLTSVNNLGGVLRRQGRYEEAKALHQRALENRERVLGADHSDTLKSLSNLGCVLRLQGKYREAEAMHRRALATRELVLGADHPYTLTSVGNLASVLGDQGNCKEAEEMHRRVLIGRERILGADHPHTLKSINNLGRVLADQGKYSEAEAMHQRVLATRGRVLGVDHPYTLTNMWNLSRTWKNQGREIEARELLQICVAQQSRILGPNHPDTVSAIAELNTWQLSDQDPSVSHQPDSITPTRHSESDEASTFKTRPRKRDIVYRFLRKS